MGIQNFSKNRLKLWSKNPRFCSLKLRDPNIVIRVKTIVYTRQDLEEFDTQIKETIQNKKEEKLATPQSTKNSGRPRTRTTSSSRMTRLSKLCLAQSQT